MTSWTAPRIGDRPVVVLGGGVLGRRIACSWAAGGYNVIIRDPSEDQRIAAVHFLDNNVPEFAKTLGDTNEQQGTYSATDDLNAALKDAWFVIEAVPEKLDLKISTFADITSQAPKDCVFGSNSSSFKSSLMLDKVEEASKSRCLNTHYSMPPTNRTVELMTSTYTDKAIFSFLVEHHEKIGMMPAVARKESTGFIFNRLWAAIKREILTILSEGVSDPQEIDRLWEEFFGGGKGGPCAMMDAVGLDTVAFIEDNYIKERHLDSKDTVDYLRKNFIEKGKLGAKSGNGGLLGPGSTTKAKDESVASHDNLAAPTLYFLDLGLGANSNGDYVHGGQVVVGSSDGKPTRAIVKGLENPDGLDISLSAGRIFWTNMGVPSKNNGSVKSARLDGSDVQDVIPPGQVHTPKQLMIDHQSSKLYFCDREGMRVHRSNFDGSQHEILVQTGDFNKPEEMKDQKNWCVGVCIDAAHGKFYWTQKGFSKSGTGRIFRANIEMPQGATSSNRNDIELLFDNLPEPIDLEFDSQNELLYWTDRGEYPIGNTVNRANVGSGVTGSKYDTLTRHLHEAIGIKVDQINKHIYFTDLGGSVYRMGLNGEEKKVIYNTDATFAGITLAHVG